MDGSEQKRTHLPVLWRYEKRFEDRVYWGGKIYPVNYNWVTLPHLVFGSEKELRLKVFPNSLHPLNQTQE